MITFICKECGHDVIEERTTATITKLIDGVDEYDNLEYGDTKINNGETSAYCCSNCGVELFKDTDDVVESIKDYMSELKPANTMERYIDDKVMILHSQGRHKEARGIEDGTIEPDSVKL